MSRLIDLDVALVDYCDGCKYEGNLCTPGDRVCGTVDFLLEQPVVDAVEVVRCEKCKQWSRNIGIADSPNGHCFCHDIETNGYDFCSYGERRSDETD